MMFDECFDERTERQHCETSCSGVFQSEPDQPISESATLEALVDLGVDERDQAGACAIGGEANRLAVNRQLVAITVRRVSARALGGDRPGEGGAPECFLALLACGESKAIIKAPVGGGSGAVARAHAGGLLPGWEGQRAC
jgi:hypothetical protein